MIICNLSGRCLISFHTSKAESDTALLATWPVVMLLYPLYASVIAIESPGKEDDEQWLAYWILYSFLTLTEMVFESVLEWIPIWYSVKLLFIAWLVLPQFKGASFIYERGSKRLPEGQRVELVDPVLLHS
ncbi:HVA22-like protein f [Hibiscus syriacus]|uniref:HVA22-like protein n=1 Tax=Hibiscus syriacus TaxID=106335 RepID=A0A6A2XF91_HIBSY|nr:HVA22-like protein f [Hibiscus syriacus]